MVRQSARSTYVLWAASMSVCLGIAISHPLKTQAQMVNVSTPFVTNSESSFENFGVSFGFGLPRAGGSGSRVVGLGPNGQLLPNIQFRQALSAPPPFGGFNPNAGASFGFNTIGRNGGGIGFGIQLAQGNSRTNVTTVPSVTMMNGGSASIFNGATRPFVVSNIPVVGGFGQTVPMIDNGVTRAIQSGQLDLSKSLGRPDSSEVRQASWSSTNSTATQGDISVAQIKAQRQAQLRANEREVAAKLKAVDAWLEKGERIKARRELKLAIALCKDAAQQAALRQRLRSLSSRDR